jgi:hypothetical protein
MNILVGQQYQYKDARSNWYGKRFTVTNIANQRVQFTWEPDSLRIAGSAELEDSAAFGATFWRDCVLVTKLVQRNISTEDLLTLISMAQEAPHTNRNRLYESWKHKLLNT